MSRKTENTGFICAYCGEEIIPLTNGSYRNHCPYCLCSLHVDNVPGDRSSDCHSLMKPVGIRYSGKKGWQVVHRCITCGVEKANRVAPDDMDTILKIKKTEELI